MFIADTSDNYNDRFLENKIEENIEDKEREN